MDSRRQLKVGSVIQEAFSDLLTREGKSLYGSAFVTLTKVKLTSDLGLARFYLSIYKAENPDEIIEKFNDRKFELKRKLGEKLRHQLRVIPEIEFFKDETMEYASHIEDLFKKIKEDDERMKAEIESPKPEIKTKTKKASTAKKVPVKRKAK